MQGMKTLGEKIFELRKQKGLSQAELARQLNITASALCRWEKGGRTPSEEDLESMAAFFGVSKDYLSEQTVPEQIVSEGNISGNKRKKIITTAVIGIVGIAIFAVIILWLNGRNRFELLESNKTTGNYGETCFEECYLVSKGCSEDRMDRFVKKRTDFLESDHVYDEYESFSFRFYESKEDYEQGESSLIHISYRTGDVLE